MDSAIRLVAPRGVGISAGTEREPGSSAGNNADVQGTTHLAGRPRIVGAKVDMGAYEFQGAGMGEFTVWLHQQGLPVDGSADYADPDGDRSNNWQEWIAGTDPGNAASALRVTSVADAPTGLPVTWESVPTRLYWLERATDLAAPFQILANNLPGQAGSTNFVDLSASGPGPYFYRVGVLR